MDILSLGYDNKMAESIKCSNSLPLFGSYIEGFEGVEGFKVVSRGRPSGGRSGPRSGQGAGMTIRGSSARPGRTIRAMGPARGSFKGSGGDGSGYGKGYSKGYRKGYNRGSRYWSGTGGYGYGYYPYYDPYWYDYYPYTYYDAPIYTEVVTTQPVATTLVQETPVITAAAPAPPAAPIVQPKNGNGNMMGIMMGFIFMIMLFFMFVQMKK